MLWESRAWAAPLPSRFCTGTSSLLCTLCSLVGKSQWLEGVSAITELSSGRKRSFLHWRAGLWEPQLLGYSSQQELYPYGADTRVQREGCTAHSGAPC